MVLISVYHLILITFNSNNMTDTEIDIVEIRGKTRLGHLGQVKWVSSTL